MSAATVPYYQWVACPDAACPNSSRGPWLVLEALGTYTAFCYACAVCGASMRLTAADR